MTTMPIYYIIYQKVKKIKRLNYWIHQGNGNLEEVNNATIEHIIYINIYIFEINNIINNKTKGGFKH